MDLKAAKHVTEFLSQDTERQTVTTTDEPAVEGNARICSRCIYDERVPSITFNVSGVCNYCRMIEDIKAEYQTGEPIGIGRLKKIVGEIKRAGRGKRYDCVVGVSGGTDSSYLVYKAVDMGLRPLAVHYDNTWNSAIATENIRKVLSKLKVDLFTYVVDNRESDDIFRAFLLAGVPELEASTDLALTQVLYLAAEKYGVKYILEGHSYQTEGVSPLGTVYFDGKYIESIHRQFGTIPMRTFPNMTFASFMKWTLLKRIRKIRPYWYINYSKEEARALLEREFGWEYYGGHHLECRITAFYHTYYMPRKFGIDHRNTTLSAAVRSGHISRDEALRRYAEPPSVDPNLVEYFCKRLGLSREEFQSIMDGPTRSYRDFKTYKRLFERLRLLFYVMAKLQLVPMSFYIKYTSKNEL